MVFFRKQDQDKISFVVDFQVKSFATSNVNRQCSINVLVVARDNFG